MIKVDLCIKVVALIKIRTALLTASSLRPQACLSFYTFFFANAGVIV